MSARDLWHVGAASEVMSRSSQTQERERYAKGVRCIALAKRLSTEPGLVVFGWREIWALPDGDTVRGFLF